MYGQEIRTTASLEAYNNQLGHMVVKHGSFFRFVLALVQEEYVKSTEMETYIKSGGLTGTKQKAFYKVNNHLI